MAISLQRELVIVLRHKRKSKNPEYTLLSAVDKRLLIRRLETLQINETTRSFGLVAGV